MGQDDDINASIAHIVLCCVAGRGISRMQGKSFTHPGMHANFFIHGVLGFLRFQSGRFNNDFAAAYGISYKASRYLALPCLMADLYRGQHEVSVIHLVSGLIPFALALSGQDNVPLGNLMIACNIISLAHYSIQNSREWGWYTAGAALFAYFVAPQSGVKVMYPLGLALMEYCAYRVFHIHYDASAGPPGRIFSNDFATIYGISYKATQYLALPSLMADLYTGQPEVGILHLVSGLIPFAMALAGHDNAYLGNLMIACNIISLFYYSVQNNRQWGFYAVGVAVFTYFVVPHSGLKLAYPLGLAVMKLCSSL